MLRKRRRINNEDADPMAGLTNLSDAMLVLALGFLIFAIMALSTNPDIVHTTPQSQEVSTGEVVTDNNFSSSGAADNSGYSQVGTVYKDPSTGELILVSS